uniref:Uncharacterized protein n=1 Tax=Oryzias latipes TaxID=8090 RepID=A0A3P9JW45_ORYLA
GFEHIYSGFFLCVFLSFQIVGESEPRELPETILAKDILVPPEVVVDVSCRDALTVRAGQIISLICRVKGRPDPEITWTKDARALSRDKRTEINSSFPLCELVISDAIRSDYGKYAICAKNSSGQAQATIVVNVLDTPDNGGTEITQYIFECRQPSQRGWTVVSNDWTKRLIKAPLTEGCEYFFRVSAENKIGAGPSTETKTPVLAVDPIEKPGEPIDLHISEIGKTFCFLKWKKPDNDGGSRNLGYHIEKKPKEADEWERIHKGAIKETYFMADRCIENQIYQFRVQTKNEGGESNWVTTPEVTVKEYIEEPTIKIKLEGVLTVRAGDSIAIESTVKGKPQPDIKWTKDDSTEEIRKSPRLQIETGADFSKILLTAARRTDSGKYYITASNSAGSCSANAVVNVLDRPGPIRDLKISGITVDRCHLAWEIPEDDGGCDIYNYIIEKCETKRGVWSVHSNAVITNKAKVTPEDTTANLKKNVCITDTPGKPEVLDVTKNSVTLVWTRPKNDGGSKIIGYYVEETNYVIQNLIDKAEYQCRITAVNKVGFGESVEVPGKHVAKDIIGMYYFTFFCFSFFLFS